MHCGQSEKAIGEYISSHPEVSVVIPGASRAEQVKNNAKADEIRTLYQNELLMMESIAHYV